MQKTVTFSIQNMSEIAEALRSDLVARGIGEVQFVAVGAGPSLTVYIKRGSKLDSKLVPKSFREIPVQIVRMAPIKFAAT